MNKKKCILLFMGIFILYAMEMMPAERSSAWVSLQGYDNYSPYGLPDFNQRQMDPDNIYCGPTSAADILWWLDSKHEILSYPDYGQDSYPLVEQMGGANDDHSIGNPPLLIGELGNYCGTSPIIKGTAPWLLRDGLRDYIADKGLSSEIRVNDWVLKPSPSFIKNQISNQRGVILLMKFYGSGDLFKEFGHYAAVQAARTAPDQMKISDPYLDNKQKDDSTIYTHNDAGIVNYDLWDLEPKPWYQSPLGSGYYQIQDYLGFRGVIIKALVIEEI